MKKNLIYILGILTCFLFSCISEDPDEPVVTNPDGTNLEFGKVNVEIFEITDNSVGISIRLESNSSCEYVDLYVNDEYTTPVKIYGNSFYQGLSGLKPQTFYRVKVRCILTNGTICYGEAEFTTKETFLVDYRPALDIDPYLYSNYEFLSVLPVDDGVIYTLRTSTDNNQTQNLTLIKTDKQGKTQWSKEYKAIIYLRDSYFKRIKLLDDNSFLLITDTYVIHQSVDGQLLNQYEFNFPEERSINDAILTTNGNLLIVGSSKRKWGKNESVWEEGYAAIFDKNKNMLHEYYYQNKLVSRWDVVVPVGPGRYMVSGIITNSADYYTYGEFSTFMLDDSLTILDTIIANDFRFIQVKASLKEDSNHIYYLCQEEVTGAYSNQLSSILQMDANGRLLTRNTYEQGTGYFDDPIYLAINNDYLVVTVDDDDGCNAMVIDKNGNKLHHIGLTDYGGTYSFVYAEYSSSSKTLTCIDNFGMKYVFNLHGYIKNPFCGFSE